MRTVKSRRCIGLVLAFSLLLFSFEMASGITISAQATTPTSTISSHLQPRAATSPHNPHVLVQQTQLSYSNQNIGAILSLSADGNTVVTSDDYGNFVDFFSRNRVGQWNATPQTLLVSDPKCGATQGVFALALSGDGNSAALVSNFQNSYTDSSGTKVCFLVRNASTWQFQQVLTLNLGQYAVGRAIALSSDGSSVLVGVPGDDNSTKGVAVTFTRTNGVWNQQQIVVPSDRAAGDKFGEAVALSGDGRTAIIGSTVLSTNNNNAGAVYSFDYNNGWQQQQKIVSADLQPLDNFGASIALSSNGQVLVVGTPSNTNRNGTAYIFTRNNNLWQQQQSLLADVSYSDAKVAVNSDGSVIAVGALLEDQAYGYIFTRNANTWQQHQQPIPGGLSANGFGDAVALSNDGNTLVFPSIYVGLDIDYQSVSVYITQGTYFRVNAPLTASPGSVISYTVTAFDQNDNLNSSYVGTVQTLSNTYTFEPSDGGSHTFTTTIPTDSTYPSYTLTQARGGFDIAVKDVSNAVITGVATIAVSDNPLYVYNLPFLANNANGYTTYVTHQSTGTTWARFVLEIFGNNGAVAAITDSTKESIDACVHLVHGGCLESNPLEYGFSGSGVLISDQPLSVLVAETTPLGNSAYTVSNSTGSSSLLVPIALHNAYGDYNTKLNIFNSGVNPAQATLQFYDQNGQLQTTATQNLSLDPHTSQQVAQDDPANNLPPNFSGWAQIIGSPGSQLAAQVTQQSQSRHFVSVANAQQSGGQTTLYAPTMFNGAFGGFVTGAQLVNPSNQSVAVTITYYSNDGTPYPTNPFNIAPHAISTIYQAGSGGNGLPSNGLPAQFYGSASINSTGDGVVMLVNQTGAVTSNGSQSGTYVAASSGADVAYLPVMSKGDYGYTTGLTIQNTSNAPVSGTIQYYDLNGPIAGNAQSFTIGPNASLPFYQGNLNLSHYYGTAVVTKTSGPDNSLLVTVNATSLTSFYTYTEPN